MSNNKGFTMIEMLFVISIILIMSIFSFSSYHHQIKYEDELVLIKNAFIEARSYAIAHQEKTYITVNKNSINITAKNYHNNLVLNKEYYFYNSHQFSYNEDGHIKIAKTLRLNTPKGVKKFVFQLGSGTFYVE